MSIVPLITKVVRSVSAHCSIGVSIHLSLHVALACVIFLSSIESSNSSSFSVLVVPYTRSIGTLGVYYLLGVYSVFYADGLQDE